MTYTATIHFIEHWPGQYHWTIDDPARKISIEPNRAGFKNKKTAMNNLKTWIARLHIDCKIIDKSNSTLEARSK